MTRSWTTIITTTTIPAKTRTILRTYMAAMEAPIYTCMYVTSGTVLPTTTTTTAQSTASTRTMKMDITVVTPMETLCASTDGLVPPPTVKQVITFCLSNYISDVELKVFPFSNLQRWMQWDLWLLCRTLYMQVCYRASMFMCIFWYVFCILLVAASLAGRETSAMNVYQSLGVVSRPYSDSHSQVSNTILHPLQIQ